MAIFKKSKISLAKMIFDTTKGDATSFYKFILLDKKLYEGCENDATIQITLLYYLIGIHCDNLMAKYDEKDVFKVIYTTVASSCDIGTPDERVKQFLAMMKERNRIIEIEKAEKDYDEAKVFTNILFSFIIKDKDLLQEYLETSFKDSKCYKAIQSYLMDRKNNPWNYNGFNLKLK